MTGGTMGKSKGRSDFLKTLRAGQTSGKRPINQVESDDSNDDDFSELSGAGSELEGSCCGSAEEQCQAADPAVERRRRQKRESVKNARQRKKKEGAGASSGIPKTNPLLRMLRDAGSAEGI